MPKNSRKQKAAADEETAANGSSIQALIAKAVQAKKAMESKSDIAQRLIKTETTSEFAAVFQPVQQDAGHYISTAEMNRTVTKSGPLRVAAYIRVSSDSSEFIRIMGSPVRISSTGRGISGSCGIAGKGKLTVSCANPSPDLPGIPATS